MTLCVADKSRDIEVCFLSVFFPGSIADLAIPRSRELVRGGLFMEIFWELVDLVRLIYRLA